MKMIMNAVWTVVGIVALAYIGFCVMLYVMQDRQVYVPSRTVEFYPSAAGLEFEDLYLSTPDGETINAWYIPAAVAGNGKTVLFCHGNAGDMGNRVGIVAALNKMGFAVMIFDYRGFGKSSGKAGEKGTYIDARTAWNYLVEKKGLKADDIVLHGQSLGGAVAAVVAEEVKPAALIIESSFTSAPDLAAIMFPWLPARLLCRYKYDSESVLVKIKSPVLIAHGRADGMIPFSHGEKLFEAAQEPKKFVELYGTHNSSGLECEEDYRKAYLEFVM